MAQAVNGNDFDEQVLQNEGLTLVDFWAPWCGPCQMLLPILEELSEEIKDDVKICKVNVDENAELASKYQIMSIPAIKIFKNGEIIDEATGMQTKEELIALIEKNK